MKSYLTLGVASVAASIALAVPARGDVVASYSFPDTTAAGLNSQDTDPNSSSSAVSFGSGLTAGTGAGQWFIQSDAGNPAPSLRVNSSSTVTTEALAVSGNRFFQFTVTPTGLPLIYQELDLDWQSFSNTSGGLNSFLSVRSSVDNFTSNLFTSSRGSGGPNAESPWDLAPISLASLGEQADPVTFRFFVWNGVASFDNNLRGSRFDNINVTAVIPEPATAGLLGLGGLTLLRRRRQTA